MKYNGKKEQSKEFSDGSGLELLDYGARMYDLQIGRWMVLHKLADQYFATSPYWYVLDRPTVAVDSDGKKSLFCWRAANDQDGWNYIYRWAQTFYKAGIEGSVYRVNSSRGK